MTEITLNRRRFASETPQSTVDFSWGKDSTKDIQWAAFYGDCEHEVLEVTSGHRITLTYNLYYSSIGNFGLPASSPYNLPLYDLTREMLQESSFMREGCAALSMIMSRRLMLPAGGLLGFFCHHQYAHARESGRKSLPRAFKGVDLAVYTVFNSLGYKAGIHPIVKNVSNKWGGLSANTLLYASTEGDYVETCLQNLADRRNMSRQEYEDLQYEYYEKRNDRSTWDDDQDEDGVDECEYLDMGYHEYLEGGDDEPSTIVGTKLHGIVFDKYEDETLVGETVLITLTSTHILIFIKGQAGRGIMVSQRR